MPRPANTHAITVARTSARTMLLLCALLLVVLVPGRADAATADLVPDVQITWLGGSWLASSCAGSPNTFQCIDEVLPGSQNDLNYIIGDPGAVEYGLTTSAIGAIGNVTLYVRQRTHWGDSSSFSYSLHKADGTVVASGSSATNGTTTNYTATAVTYLTQSDVDGLYIRITPPGTSDLRITAASVNVVSYTPIAPNTPTASAVPTPSIDTTPTFGGSAFADANPQDSHYRSQWQVRTSAGSYASPAWDSGVSASLTSISTSALADGSYCYQVRYADQLLTWSAYSAEQCFNVDTTAPTPATATGTANSSTQITWTQTVATDAQGNLSATPYSIDSGAPAWQASTTFVSAGLSANTQYTRTVRVRDTLGNAATGSVSRYTLSGAPTGLSATGANWSVSSSYAVQLSWTAPAGGASSYNIRWSADGYASIRASTASTSRAMTGLAANTSYTYKVCSVNTDGIEEAVCSGAATGTTPPVAPTAPATSAISNTSATFSWTAAVGATKYRLVISPNASCTAGADITVDPAVSPQVYGSLLTDRTYTFRVLSYSTSSGAYGAPTACTALSSSLQRTAITVGLDAGSVNLGTAVPLVPLTGSTTITTTTYGATGYTVDAEIDQQLTSGGNTIPATTSGSIAVPGVWSGTGFGITVSSATNLAGKWGAGTNFAALTTTPTQIHSTGAAFAANTANTTATVVGYRMVGAATQPVGVYTCTVTYTVIASA